MTLKNKTKAHESSGPAKPLPKQPAQRTYQVPAVRRDRKLSSVTGVPVTTGQTG